MIVYPDSPKSFSLAAIRPAARPVVTRKGNTFTPKSSREAQSEVRAMFIQANPGWVADKTTRWALVISLLPKTRRRADVDNLAKTVMDGLNGALYHDDGQVDQLTVIRRWDRTPTSPVAMVECYHLTPREATP